MSAQVIAFSASNTGAMRNIERVWQLRAQVLEHVRAIEDLCEQMSELPHVYGILPDEACGYLNDVENMLTPCMDENDEKEMEAEAAVEDGAAHELAQWRALQVFAKAKGISLED